MMKSTVELKLIRQSDFCNNFLGRREKSFIGICGKEFNEVVAARKTKKRRVLSDEELCFQSEE